MPSVAVATALVLCGGGSRRMGSDKTTATLGGATVLDHLLDGLPADWPLVVVGPERPTRRAVRWTRESPAGGGPVAAVAAGGALEMPSPGFDSARQIVAAVEAGELSLAELDALD